MSSGLVLNTNVNSLVAQNALSSSGTQLSQALEQLSTGLRINTAADDPAGYAIVNGMTSQINGLNQATQNANDGVSLAQTASGAMSEIVNDLQSMRDLAVESLNATNSSSDRADLNDEFQQLMNDINSVASQTQFNGVSLLNGSFQGATFQVGANVGQSITVGAIASASSSAIGNYYNGVAAVADASVQTASGSTLYTGPTAATQGVYSASGLAGTNGLDTAVDGSTVTLNVNINGTDYATSAVTLSGNPATDLTSIAAAINQAISSQGNIVATVNSAGTGIQLSGTTGAGAGDVVNFSVASATNASGNTITAGADTLNDLGVDSSDVIGTYSTGATLPTYGVTGTVTDGITESVADTAGTGTYSITINGTTYTATSDALTGVAGTDAAAIVAALNTTGSAFKTAGYTAAANGAGDLTITSQAGPFTVESDGFTDGTGLASGTFLQGFDNNAATVTTAGTPGTTAEESSSVQYLSGLNVTTVDDSNLTLISIDNALQQLAASGADLGAYQNRFQAAITGLSTDSTNLSSARSSIQDTDYAQATSQLTEAQILQQAGTAMVAQANEIPQNVLTLLDKLP
jgi:flagellin